MGQGPEGTNTDDAQGTLTSFMHQIRSSTDFKECELAPLPQPESRVHHEHSGQVGASLVDVYAAAARSRHNSRWGAAAPSFVPSSSRAGRQAATITFCTWACSVASSAVPCLHIILTCRGVTAAMLPHNISLI